jgi:hypothetical protein
MCGNRVLSLLGNKEQRDEGRGDEEEDVSSYSMTSRNGEEYWKLKEEALERTLWRSCFRRGYGPVVRQTAC